MAQHPLIQVSYHSMITKQEKHTTLHKVPTQFGLTDSNASTNLPAHGTTSTDPSLTSQHDNETRKAHYATQATYPSWSYGFQCFHKPARSWSNSTNRPARSPTLWTFLPVVQHTWSTSYEPLNMQHLSSVSTEHTNLPTRIPTREYQDMNLLAHIPTCSSPIINLPPHDNIKDIPNKDQHNKPCKTYHNAPCHYTIA